MKRLKKSADDLVGKPVKKDKRSEGKDKPQQEGKEGRGQKEEKD